MFKEKYKMKKVGFVFTKAVSEKAVIKYDIISTLFLPIADIPVLCSQVH
jgi:hypothetical protein